MTMSTNQNIALAVLVFDFVIFHLVMNINTMSLLQSLGWNLDLWPKRIGQETDTVYLKYVNSILHCVIDTQQTVPATKAPAVLIHS